jgi:hypothetical protein
LASLPSAANVQFMTALHALKFMAMSILEPLLFTFVSR